MIEIVDILFGIGTGVFTLSGIRQIRRIYKTKATRGVSLTHYHMKLFALSCMLSAYIMLFLPISIVISISDITINLFAIYLITKYRNIRFFSM